MLLSRNNPILLWWSGLRHFTLIPVIILASLGMIISSSVSYPMGEKLQTGTFYFFFKHTAFSMLGITLMVTFSMQTRDTIQRITHITLPILFVALVAVVISGDEVNGARRWLRTPIGTLQPSEIIKPFYIALLAQLFCMAESPKQTKPILLTISSYLLLATLLGLEPDFGMIIIYTIIFGVMIYMSPISLKKMFTIFAALAGIVTLIASQLDHVKFRILNFINPSAGSNYQTNKALLAIKNGGFLGKGVGESKIKFLLPEAHNDFVFAIICEEFGYIFVFTLISLYFIIIADNLLFLIEESEEASKIQKLTEKYSKQNPKTIQQYQKDIAFSKYFISTTTVLIGTEVFISAAVSLRLLPTKGMTMPFISYGGSSTVSHLILIGIMTALSRKKHRFFLDLDR